MSDETYEVTDPIVVTLTYTQTAKGPKIKVECDRGDLYPDVLVDILLRAARAQDRNILIAQMEQTFRGAVNEMVNVGKAMGKMMRNSN